MQIAVVPKPSEIQTRPGVFAIASARVIYNTTSDDQRARLKWVAQYLADGLATGGATRGKSDKPVGTLSVPVLPEIQEGVQPTGSIRLALDEGAEALGEEGYYLEVDADKVTLTARCAAGVFYGVQTLFQLVVSAQNNGHARQIPCVSIRDQPRFPWRGFMLDSARHMQSVSEIKRIIDRLAHMKLNRLHWHIADDQGWRLEILKYPKLTSVGAWRGEGAKRYGGFYTQQQVREIVAYAADRYITVIPEIDMPGHSNAALYAYPELSCSGDPINVDPEGGLEAYTKQDGRLLFCAGRDNVLTFLKDVMTEVAELFDPPYIHLGGDERPTDIWSKCPRCKQRMQDLKLKDEDELEFWFANKISTFVHEQLKVGTIGWGDNLKKAGMPKGQVVQGWLEGQTKQAAEMGWQTINSFHEWVYLDYPATEAAMADKPDWMPLLPIEKVYGFEPIPEGLNASQEALILGGESPIWTEYVKTYDELIRQVMPRLLAFSETLWSPKQARDFDDFKLRADALSRGQAPPATPVVKVTKSLQFGANSLDKAGQIELNR